MRQFLILFAGAVLLSQLVNGLPHMKREAVSAVAESEVKPKVQLLHYPFDEKAELGKWLLDESNVVVSNAVHELNKIPVKSELLQSTINRMSHFATESSKNNVESKEGIQKIYDNLKLLEDLLKYYENSNADSELKSTVKTALENNGYETLQAEFGKKVKELANIFEKAFNRPIKVLTSAEENKFSIFDESFTIFVNLE